MELEFSIGIKLSKEQLEKLGETGKLSIKITLDAVQPICDETTEDQWPDTRGNENVELLIRKAKACGLSLSDLPKLTIWRLYHLLDLDRRSGKEEIREIEKCLGLSFFSDELSANMPEDTLVKDIFDIRVANTLSRQCGVVTMTDLRTLTTREIWRTEGIGKERRQEIQDYLNSMHM